MMKCGRPTSRASSPYDADLAYVHDAGFTEFARESAIGLLRTLQSAGISSGLVIDLGCGSGVWARELVRAGYDVVGVDISPAMIEIARSRAPEATFHVDSFLSFKLPKCRAVTALGEVLNYRFDGRNGAAALRAFCKRAYAALEPGGLFIFDIAEPGRNRDRAPGFWEGHDWVNLVEFHTDPSGFQLTRRIVTFRKTGEHYRRGEETHELQLYRSAVVAAMLRKIGFRVRQVRSYGAYRLPDCLPGFIARKP